MSSSSKLVFKNTSTISNIIWSVNRAGIHKIFALLCCLIKEDISVFQHIPALIFIFISSHSNTISRAANKNT